MSALTILCVTKFEPHALRLIVDMHLTANIVGAEFVLVADGASAYQSLHGLGYRPFRVDSKGYIESVLNEAVALCTTDYILRLDDDERCSNAMVRWLKGGDWGLETHWRFPRAHLWGDVDHALMTKALWPDLQTRLSVKEKSASRSIIHTGSPHGGGTTAPCALEHYKFIVKSLSERRAMVEHYESIRPGAGSQFKLFSVPEDSYSPDEIIGATERWDGERVPRFKVAA